MATQTERRAAKRNEAGDHRQGKAMTRDQLNLEAARLEIPGRSRMGKDHLRRAIRRHGGKAD